jgi:hypothetical protein
MCAAVVNVTIGDFDTAVSTSPRQGRSARVEGPVFGRVLDATDGANNGVASITSSLRIKRGPLLIACVSRRFRRSRWTALRFAKWSHTPKTERVLRRP